MIYEVAMLLKGSNQSIQKRVWYQKFSYEP